MMKIRHKQKFSKLSGLPFKSSFRKRKTKCRVKWSPDVKDIVKKSNTKSRMKAYHSKLLLKINDNKTTYDLGKLHAEEDNSMIKLRLKKKTNCVGVILLDKQKQKILQVSFKGMIIRRNGRPSEKIKMKLEIGDVIWKMKNKRNSKLKDYDLSWLNNTIKLYGSVCDLKEKKQSVKKSSKICYRKVKRKDICEHNMSQKNRRNTSAYTMN